MDCLQRLKSGGLTGSRGGCEAQFAIKKEAE
jgi:hypothetical protein